jgi:integrase
LDADGVSALSFAQAQEKARLWFSEVAIAASGEAGTNGPYTVSDAARDYMDWFSDHRKGVKETQYTINGHILPDLGELEVSKLTATKLRKWHQEIAKSPARLRTRPGISQRYRQASNDPEEIRPRRSTANRNLTVLKAILNHAWHEGRVANDDAWRRVKPFQGVDTARARYLSADECVRLVNACDPDLRALVQAALFTGCRYAELTRVTAADFNSDAGTLTIRQAKSGKPRHVVLDSKGQRFFSSMVAGRSSTATIFLRENGSKWGRSYQRRPLNNACKRAGIVPSANFHALRHTYASHLVMNGAPLHVVSENLGHSDTRMVEKHYAHLKPSYVADAIRAAAPNLGIETESTVKRINFRRSSDSP